MAMLDEAERNLVNLMRGEKAQNEKNTMQYSISPNIIDENGKEYGPGVVLDNISLEDLSTAERKEFIYKYVTEELAGQQFLVQTPDGDTQILEISDTKRKYRKTGGKPHKVIDKLAKYNNTNYTKNLAILHIDEIIKVSQYKGSSYSSNHGKFDENGWQYRKAILQDTNKKVYEAILNIAKTADGKNIIYEIRINSDLLQSKSRAGTHGRVKRPKMRHLSASNNISNPDGTVNQSAQTRQENITKDNKNTKATGKATGLTIELVMMITRVVIIIKKPIIE